MVLRGRELSLKEMKRIELIPGVVGINIWLS